MSEMKHYELSVFRGWREIPGHWRAIRTWNLWTNRRWRIVLLFCQPDDRKLRNDGPERNGGE